MLNLLHPGKEHEVPAVGEQPAKLVSIKTQAFVIQSMAAADIESEVIGSVKEVKVGD